jgi:autotransporter-associated beta strand protein
LTFGRKPNNAMKYLIPTTPHAALAATRRPVALVAMLAGLTMATLPLMAQTTYYWRSEASNGDWNEANNWWRGFAETPTGSEVLRFNNGVQLTMNNNLTAVNRYRIYFESGSGARAISGSTENVFYDYSSNTPLIQNDSGNAQAVNFPIGIGNNNGSMDLWANSGTLTFGGTITARGGTRTLYPQGADNITLNGALQDGSGAVLHLVKFGNGTLTLNVNNPYSGNTTINAGTLSLGAAGAIANSPTITVAGSASFDVSAVSGFTLGSAQTLMGSGTVSGATTIAGTLAPGASVGTISTGAQTWAPGGTLEVEMDAATGSAGTAWDLTAITGGLTITATNKPTTDVFTVKVIGPGGGPTGFSDTTAYSWVIATTTAGVNGFKPGNFVVDASAFGVSFTGSFSVALVDDAVHLVYAPAGSPCDNLTTASSGLELDGETMVMTFVNESGLVSVQALRKENCTIVGREYTTTAALTNSGAALPGEVELDARTLLTPGTKKVVLWATRAVAGPAAVNVIAIDECGRGVSFDPIITTVEILEGNKVEQRFEGLLSAEHFLNVVNGTPGLERLEININGRVFAVNLTDGQRVASDLRSAMREGTDNVVILTGHGAVGSSAFVTLTDTATGNEQPLEEIVLLTLGHSAAGLTLTWPETLEGWTLQASASANAGWADVTTPPTAANGQWTLTLTPTTGAQFYRLTAPTGVARPATTGTGTSLTPTTQPSKIVYDALLW